MKSRIGTALFTSTLVLLLLASSVAGQTQPADANSPEAVALRAMAALRENRISDFAAEMHPEALSQFKTAMVQVADAAAKQGQGNEMLRLFNNVKSVDELRQLDDAALFTAFMEGAMKFLPHLRDALGNMTMGTLGHVREEPDLAHVVYRGAVMMGDMKFTRVQVISLKSKADGWGMLLSDDLASMTTVLKRQFKVED